ncbi:MAG: hypothetical protein RLZZ282_1173, partial [Verrucomicrobiota bacterium]
QHKDSLSLIPIEESMRYVMVMAYRVASSMGAGHGQG